MKKKEFCSPELEVVTMEEDVICTSGEGTWTDGWDVIGKDIDWD